MSMQPDVDPLQYYHLERFLFEVVHPRFHRDHSIGAFDFFSIVIWKANRAKSKIAKRILKRAKALSEPTADLESITRKITASMYIATTDRERLRIMLVDWSFRLPMASAVLTVLWPDRFTVYDVRVCERLQKFESLASRGFEGVCSGYEEFIEAVEASVSHCDALRDKDRYMWGESAVEQLKGDILARFQDAGNSWR